MRRRTLLVLLLTLVGCGGKAASYEYAQGIRGAPGAGTDNAGSSASASSGAGISSGGTPAADDGGDSGYGGVQRSGAGGGAGSSGDVGDGGDAGASAAANGGMGGVISAGGSGGTGGEGAAAGTGGAVAAGGAKACASVTECPRPISACLSARCSAGSCVTDYVPAGVVYVLDAPADCHATTACDGFGHATLAVDQSNAPLPSNQCLVGTCNDSGTVGSEALPKGTPCHADTGGGKCDGVGSCVACLVTADCPLGQTCNTNRQCIGQACSASHCGGACPPCVIDPQCLDTQQDGNETDTDCGGGICPDCALGEACLGNRDCASFACDAGSLTCVADACHDHRMDSDESDVDCGGSSASCNRCDVGKKCNGNIDCNPGHICNSSKVCQ